MATPTTGRFFRWRTVVVAALANRTLFVVKEIRQFVVLDVIEQRVAKLLAQMTLAEKIGQMTQRNAGSQHEIDVVTRQLREGRIGSVLTCLERPPDGPLHVPSDV